MNSSNLAKIWVKEGKSKEARSKKKKKKKDGGGSFGNSSLVVYRHEFYLSRSQRTI